MSENNFVKRQIVLGAGASANKSGGYPLGGQLIKFICQDNGQFIGYVVEEIKRTNPSLDPEVIDSFQNNLENLQNNLKKHLLFSFYYKPYQIFPF